MGEMGNSEPAKFLPFHFVKDKTIFLMLSFHPGKMPPGLIGPSMNVSHGSLKHTHRPKVKLPHHGHHGIKLRPTRIPKKKNRGKDQRIVNGKVADKNQFPYQVVGSL